MSLRTSAYTVEVGFPQQLEMTVGEDREFDLTFTYSGSPVDFTLFTILKITVRNRTNGTLVASRTSSGFVGSATAGTPRFIILAADTAAITPGYYDVDVQGYDGTYWTELLITSPFLLLKTIGLPSDRSTTSPAAIALSFFGFGMATGTTNFNATGGYLYRCNPSGGNFTAQLPKATGMGRMLIVVNQSTSTATGLNKITVAPNGTDTIGQVATSVDLYAGDKLFLCADALSDWMVL